MNDADEDENVEGKLNERMVQAGGTAPPHPSLMAPAALYLTAIIECAFCLFCCSLVSDNMHLQACLPVCLSVILCGA